MSLAPPPIPTTDELLRVLVEQTAAVTGQEFFDALTRTLCLTLNANHVALSQLSSDDPGHVETLSAFAEGRHQPNFSYALDTTPCKNVLGTSFTHHPDRVAELFPDDHFFAETNTRSYIGVPLATPDRRPLGLLTLCHDHPTHHLAHLGDVLTLFAGRAAAEISRLHAERALRDERASLERRVLERTADLAAVTSHVPCILWQADAEGCPGWDRDIDGQRHLFTWRARIIDASAAQSVLPLDVPPGTRYWDAWNLARHPDDANTIFASTAQALIMGLPHYSREFRCLDRTGQVHWVHEEIAVRPLGDDGGDGGGGPPRWQLFGVVTNVTARKLAELALRESEQRFRAMADAAPVLIWVTDPDDRNSWFNKPWRDFIGPAAVEQNIFDAWENALHPEDQAHTLRAHRAYFAARVPFHLEYRLRRHDGQYRWFLDHAAPRFHPDGSFAGYLGSCVDITDRKRAELDLSAVTGRVPCILWRSAVDGLPGWQHDPDGQQALYRWDLTIIDEHAAQRLLPIDVPPGNCYRDAWGHYLHPDDRPHLRRTTADALLNGRPYFDREYRVTDRLGQLHWLHEDVFVEPRGAGRWELFGVVTDVTPHKLAELALRDSEARYDLAARAGRVGIWDWNLLTGAIYLSDNLKALLGYPPDFPLEHPLTWHEHLHRDDVPTVLAATRDHFDGVTPAYEIEVRRRHKDGSWLWFLARGTATRDPDTGNPVRMTGSLTDITDRKRAEEALRASESRYALATTFGRVGIWEWHIGDETLHLSDSLKALLGYAPDELADMDRLTWRAHLHPDDLPTVLAAAQGVLDGRAPGYELEVRRRHRDGSYRWILSRASVTRDPATGAPLRMTGVVTDVTDRKRAEEALRASERRYALATEAGHVGVWEYDADAGSLYLSPYLCTALGYAPGELDSLDIWRDLIHPDDLPAILAIDADPACTRFEFEARRRHRDKSYRWFLSRGTIARDPATGRTLRITGTHTDVTDRKLAEQALRESQRRYALATDAGGVGVWEHDIDAGTVHHSPNSLALLGYAPEEIASVDAWMALVHPDDRAAGPAVRDDPAANTFAIEVRRRHRDGSWRWFLSRGSIARDPATGRAVRMTGAHTDITDRKLAEQALRASQHRYALATDAGGVGIWEYDVDADSLYLSPNLPGMLGYTPAEIPDMRAWRGLLHPDDLPAIRAANADPAVTTFESLVRRRHKDGSWRWLLSRGTKSRDTAGRLTRITGIHTDVTDLKRAQEALRTSESRYALATVAGRVGTWEYDLDADSLYLSPNLPPMLGYAADDFPTFQAWLALVHPDDVPTIRAAMDDPASYDFEMEVRRRHKDGSWRWLGSRGSMTRDPATGRLTRINGTFTDVTDRRRAEEALRTSESRYALATEAGSVGIWECEYATGAVYVSAKLSAMLGRPPGEIATIDAWRAHTHPDDAPRIRALREDPAVADYALEVRRRHADGSWRWFLSRGTITRDPDGNPLRTTGTLTDITDLKRAEEALRESQRRFDIAAAAGRVGVIDWDLPTDQLFISPALKSLLGYADHELPNNHDAWRDLLHPDDRSRSRDLTEDHVAGRTPSYELEVRRRHKDGSYLWFLARGSTTRAPDGTPLRFTASLTDITDRKRADDALRASEAHLRTLLEQSPIATFIFSPDGDFVRCNSAAADLYGIPEHELRGYNVFANPRLQDPILDAYHAARAGRHATIPEIPFTIERGRLAGRTFWLRGSVYPLRDPATGRVHALVALNEDVTERKRVEEALRSSERRFRKLVEQSPLSTQFLAPDGTMRTANRAFERLFGVTVGQLAGYNVLADPQLADKGITPLLRRAFNDGEPATLPTIPYVPPFGDLAGQERWCAALIFPVKDAAGRIEEVVLIHHDVTEQKRAEDALRASEEQYRRAADSNRRLLLELDHRVRNNLAGLASLVSVMRTLAPSVDAFAVAIDARLRAMSHVHHLLSQSQGRDLDLRSLLTSFLAHSRNLSPHPTPVRLDGPPVPLPSHLALPLTLILSELLTNSAKYGAHSSPAGSVSLSWTLSRPRNEDGESRIEDGTNPSSPSSILHPPSSLLTFHWTESGGPTPNPHPTPSLGSTLIQSFSTRELAGTCSLTYPPAGAAHTLTFPLP